MVEASLSKIQGKRLTRSDSGIVRCYAAPGRKGGVLGLDHINEDRDDGNHHAERTPKGLPGASLLGA